MSTTSSRTASLAATSTPTGRRSDTKTSRQTPERDQAWCRGFCRKGHTYRRATSSLPFRVLLQILRDGRYSVKRELSEEDRAALAIEVKLMERSLVQAGVDLP
jgi:hypothetical protein